MNDLLKITQALEGFSSSEVGFIVTKAVRGETIKTQWSLDVQAYIKSAEEESINGRRIHSLLLQNVLTDRVHIVTALVTESFWLRIRVTDFSTLLFSAMKKRKKKRKKNDKYGCAE